jgi:hypothetical protein
VKEEKSDDLSQVCVKNSSSINNNIQDNINGIPESNINRGDVAKMELSNCQPTGQLVHPPGQTTESSNGFRKNQMEKKDSNLNYNGYQNQNNSSVINSSNNLQNNVFGTGISNGQHNNNSISSQNQTIPLCEQEGQVKMMKLAGLTVIMHRKKGEIIYRLADNMSVSSLSDAQREALLKEIKTLHDSNAIVTQSMPQPTQDQGTSTTSSQSTINAMTTQLTTTSSLPEHPSVVNHSTSRVQSSLAPASQLIRSSSFPISTSTSSNKSINSTATLNTQTASKQLYIPLASRPPLVVTEAHSAVQLSDRSQSTTPSNMTSQTLYPSSPLEDSFYSDGSSRSTRRYTKTGRYAKKRSTDEIDSQYTQEYTTQYQHIPINTSVPMNNQMSAQTSQFIQPVQSPQPVQSTYYTSTTPTTRPIVHYYSAPTPLHRPSTSHGLKRSFQSTGLQRTAEEINHNLDIVQR